MKDQFERMVAEAKAKAIQAREAEAARERAERERRIELDQQIAEVLLTQVRPLLDEFARSVNRQIEGAWHVEWHVPQNGDAALQIESPEHPGFVAVAIDRDWQVALSYRSNEHDQVDSRCEIAQLQPQLLAAMQAWVERLMLSPLVRFRD